MESFKTSNLADEIKTDLLPAIISQLLLLLPTLQLLLTLAEGLLTVYLINGTPIVSEGIGRRQTLIRTLPIAFAFILLALVFNEVLGQTGPESTASTSTKSIVVTICIGKFSKLHRHHCRSVFADFANWVEVGGVIFQAPGIG